MGSEKLSIEGATRCRRFEVFEAGDLQCRCEAVTEA